MRKLLFAISKWKEQSPVAFSAKKVRLVSVTVHTMRKENRESQIGQSNLSFDKVQKIITKVKKISLYM